MRGMTRSLVICLVLIQLFLTLGAGGESKAASKAGSTYVEDEDQKIVSAQLCENTLFVPTQYFANGAERYEKKQNKNVLYLRALVPGIEPQTRKDREELARIRGIGRSISILVGHTSCSRKSTLKEKLISDFNVALKSYNPVMKSSNKFGLSYYPSNKKNGNGEIYFKKNGDVLTTYLICGVDLSGEAYFLSCTHNFFMERLGALIRLSYDKRFLSQWRMLEGGVRERLMRFLSKPIIYR